jgi:Periplasmic copper-binding protein (NosD)
VVTQDTTLTADLGCDGTALVIGAPGITLDLGGHSVSSISRFAIVNVGHDDVRIRNGAVHGESGLIHLSGVSRNVVRDVSFEGLIAGVQLTESHQNRIVSNGFVSVALALDGSDDNVIAHNVLTHYESVISLGDSNHNRVVDNIVWVGRSGALALTAGSHHNQVRRNTLLGDTYAVVSLEDASDNDLVNNTIATTVPAGAAAEIDASNRNLFARNTVFGVGMGFRVEAGDANAFRHNDLSGEPLSSQLPSGVGDGLAVTAGASATVLQDNTVGGFDDDGIDVDAPGTRLRGNSADDNGDLGIEAVPGVIDQGGNTASGNGNPLQCTNVFCG